MISVVLSWFRSRHTDLRPVSQKFRPALRELEERAVPSGGRLSDVTQPKFADALPQHSGVDVAGIDARNGYPLPPGKVPDLAVADPKPVPALPPAGTTITATGKPGKTTATTAQTATLAIGPFVG